MKILPGEVVSLEACEKMMNILDDQKLNSILPSKLSENMRVAHKTGSITGQIIMQESST